MIDKSIIHTSTMIEDKVQFITDTVTEWVDSLDRERLGRFAVPRDEFIAYVSWRKHYEQTRNHSFKKTIKMDAILGLRYSPDIENQAWAEYLFWTNKAADENAKVNINAYHDNLDEGWNTYRFHRIYRYSECHDYFAVGIWDIDFIQRCISDNIDPNIALGLVR